MSTLLRNAGKLFKSLRRCVWGLRDTMYSAARHIERKRKNSPLAAIEPAPGKLIEQIGWDVITQQVDWGKDSDVHESPDVYTVEVSREAWEGYYRDRVQEDGSFPMLTQAVEKHVRQRSFLDDPIEVFIALEPLLEPGDFEIKASFSASTRPSAKGESGSRTATKASQPAQDSSPEEQTPAFHSPADQNTVCMSRTPQLNATASVAMNGTTYRIGDQTTIGIRRGESDDQADIMLPLSQDLKYVSRKHGRFSRSAETGTWTYEQLGSNGSALIRNGKSFQLAKEDTIELEHADMLYLAESKHALTFRDEGGASERTVCQPAAGFSNAR